MIHVLIERQVANGMISTYEELARKALQQTYMVHGFISGEAFANTDDIHNRFLFCKWRSKNDWNRWIQSPERELLMNTIGPVLEGPEKITLLKN